MTSDRIFIIMTNNLVNYPPMLSLIRVMIELGKNVYYIGLYSDDVGKKQLEDIGVTFIPIVYQRVPGQIEMVKRQRAYKKGIRSVIRDYSIDREDLIWYVYSDSAYFLLPDLIKLRYVVHFYEFVNSKLSWKYQLLYPFYKMEDLIHYATAIVHCEYNRAQITRGQYSLRQLPYIIPNKPYFNEKEIDNPPQDIGHFAEEVKKRLNGKYVILYQGIFESNERRLEEFCDAMKLLPEDCVFVAMGTGGDYYTSLKKTYESDRIIFIPFIRPPYHLLITKLASVGVLSYNPLDKSFAGVINPLYCAPNKIFEFGRYGIPMISNDIPGLKYIFEKYNCGRVVRYPITAEEIAKVIKEIRTYNDKLKVGSADYYNSVDLVKTISEIINEIN